MPPSTRRAAAGACSTISSQLKLCRIGGFLGSEAFCLNLLDLFQGQQQLVHGQALRPATEAVTLQFPDDLAQPRVLGALGGEHRLKGERISCQRFGRSAHGTD